MNDREKILSALPHVQLPELQRAEYGPPCASTALTAMFTQRFLEVGGELATPETLGSLRGALALIDLTAKPFVSDFGLVETVDPWQAEMGVTVADAAIAESGTLLTVSKAGQRRMASLSPPIHLAVLRTESIFPTLEDAWRLSQAGTAVFITGPSRTADIEGILVRGVHGPGRVIVLLLT